MLSAGNKTGTSTVTVNRFILSTETETNLFSRTENCK